MSTPLLEVRNLRVHYGAGKNPLKAVDNVSLTVNRGECVGLVGESGCGKSTLGRAVLRLEKWAGGDVLFDGVSVGKLGGAKLKAYRKRAQMVFQDPYGSLNPRISIGGALEEVLKVHGENNPAARHARVGSLLLEVGLRPEFASRYPHEFSGGQRQRIGIARALAVDPELIIADEPVSALDVSVQVQVLNLLRDIQQRKGIAMLFVAHDLAVVRYISQRVVVMYLGRVMESGSAEPLYNAPAHPYTAKLLAAVPDVEKGLRKRTEGGALEKPTEPAASRPERGCPFAPRCPLVEPACRDSAPELGSAGPDRLAACRRLEVQLASQEA